ncbi:MAG: adenosylmethionine decarboxylase [Betaproteobacteria bacterium]|nr:adenosylmethionine decarboxylase [Betaproteobacteria bacterium]
MHDAAWIERHCLKLIEDAGLTPIAHVFHSFGDGGGVTGMVVLAESHLSLHTWPEEGFVTVDVYVCNYSEGNRDKARQIFDAMVQTYAPQSPRTFSIDRA